MSDTTTTTTTTDPAHATPSPTPAPPRTSPPALAWARDFAIVGGVSALLTPFIMAGAFVGARYLLFAAAGGVIGGFVLGLVFARATGGQRPEDDRSKLPLWVIALWAPLLGGLWGASVGLVAAFGLPHPGVELIGASMMLAAIAGALQLGWFWAAYYFARARRAAAWPVVVAACLLPIVGTATLYAVALSGSRSF
jgi:hypothetical protein